MSDPILREEWFTDSGSYNGVSYAHSGPAFNEGMLVEAPSLEWTCEPDVDSDEPEISMPLSQWADLVQRAKSWDRWVARCSTAACGCVCSTPTT